MDSFNNRISTTLRHRNIETILFDKERRQLHNEPSEMLQLYSAHFVGYCLHVTLFILIETVCCLV